MKRRELLLAATSLAALLSTRAAAQGSAGIRRIGFHLPASTDAFRNLVEVFRHEMKALGYVEGRDIAFDFRWAENRIERLPTLAAELVALNPAVIVTMGSPGVDARQKATSTVPIVFASAGDPVGQGFVKSLRRPGGNITGVAFNEEINKKIYEVVKGVMPGATRIATLVNAKNVAQKHHLDDVPAMEKALGFESILVHATREEELEAAFEHATRVKAHALVVGSVAPFLGLRGRIVQLQAKYGLPTFHGTGGAVQAGAVASYSFPFEQNFRRAAAIVDKILKGANPAEIPVELPTVFEVAVNLKSARALGIVVPQTFLLRANLVID